MKGAQKPGQDIASRLLVLLAERPTGVTSKEARTLLQASQNGVCRAARQLLAERRAVAIRVDHANVLCAPEHERTTRGALMVVQLEQERLRLDRVKLQSAERWHRARKADWYPGGYVFGEEPMQRVVSAASAAPLRKLGPASVWEVAA